MQTFIDEVHKTVDRRFADLRVDAKTLSAAELKRRFGRTDVSGPASHFEVGLGGTPCALTVTVLNQQQKDDYTAVQALSAEVGRLQAEGRLVAFREVMVAPQGTILLDIVGPQGTATNGSLQQSAEGLLEELLDHDSVRPLLKVSVW